MGGTGSVTLLPTTRQTVTGTAVTVAKSHATILINPCVVSMAIHASILPTADLANRRLLYQQECQSNQHLNQHPHQANCRLLNQQKCPSYQHLNQHPHLANRQVLNQRKSHQRFLAKTSPRGIL